MKPRPTEDFELVLRHGDEERVVGSFSKYSDGKLRFVPGRGEIKEAVNHLLGVGTTCHLHRGVNATHMRNDYLRIGRRLPICQKCADDYAKRGLYEWLKIGEMGGAE